MSRFLQSFVPTAITVALFIIVGGVLEALPEYRTILAEGWLEVGRRLAMVFGISVALGCTASLLCWLFTADFWPANRRRAGRQLEKVIALLSVDQLDEQIAIARGEFEASADQHLRAKWFDWLTWLERQRKNRPVISSTSVVPVAPDLWLIRPAFGPQLVMAGIGVPFIVLGVWGSIDQLRSHHPWWVTLACFVGLCGLGGFCAGVVSTRRIHLTTERLTLTAFWRQVWSIERSRAEIVEGGVGDGISLPGYRVFDKVTGKQVGEILSAQFRAADLERLAALFPRQTS